MAKGLFRDGNYAQVSFEGKVCIRQRRDRFELAQYQPPFKSLPAQKDYEATAARFGLMAADGESPPS